MTQKIFFDTLIKTCVGSTSENGSKGSQFSSLQGAVFSFLLLHLHTFRIMRVVAQKGSFKNDLSGMDTWKNECIAVLDSKQAHLRTFTASSPYYPLSCHSVFQHLISARLASRLELGSLSSTNIAIFVTLFTLIFKKPNTGNTIIVTRFHIPVVQSVDRSRSGATLPLTSVLKHRM